MQDLSLVEAMQRIRGMALEKIRSAGIVTEDSVIDLIDSIMNIALGMLQTGQRLFVKNNPITKNYAK